MKRNLLFAAALLAGVAVSAQEYGIVDYASVDGGTETLTPLTANTVVAKGTSLEVKVGVDDSYKSVSVNTDGFDTFVFDGTELFIEMGIQGNGNPKTSTGGNPTDIACYGDAVPVQGCAYTFTAPGTDANTLVGYFYACAKISPNKQYWVTEAGKAVGYELDMVMNGAAEHFEVIGDPVFNQLSQETIDAQFTNIPAAISAAGGWKATPSLDEMRGYDRGTWAESANGMGYIKFPVYGGVTYYFGASGSKMSLAAFYLTTNGAEAAVSLRSSLAAAADLVLAEGDGNAISSVESAAEVVAEEYYTVSGIRVAEMVPGLNLVKQTLSDGSVKTVKVIK